MERNEAKGGGPFEVPIMLNSVHIANFTLPMKQLNGSREIIKK